MNASVFGKVCVFFGHRDAFITRDTEQKLEETIRHLIDDCGVGEFWLGGYGTFDSCALGILRRIRNEHTHYMIQICCVLAYPYSQGSAGWYEETFDDIIYPTEAEKGPARSEIVRRNKWMAENCDYFVCYIDHDYGGAYQALKIAKKQNKAIINLGKIDIV